MVIIPPATKPVCSNVTSSSISFHFLLTDGPSPPTASSSGTTHHPFSIFKAQWPRRTPSLLRNPSSLQSPRSTVCCDNTQHSPQNLGSPAPSPAHRRSDPRLYLHRPVRRTSSTPPRPRTNRSHTRRIRGGRGRRRHRHRVLQRWPVPPPPIAPRGAVSPPFSPGRRRPPPEIPPDSELRPRLHPMAAGGRGNRRAPPPRPV
mmetsp:Transcript_30052/g.30411  ORF Transcript_30052/g.30411 Transcript_30052/m.30411 type:complete len:202 (-) Transcript_30052:71-676(-)